MADALEPPARNPQTFLSSPYKQEEENVATHDRKDVAKKVVKKVMVPVSEDKFVELLSKDIPERPELELSKVPFDIVRHLNHLSGLVAKQESK